MQDEDSQMFELKDHILVQDGNERKFIRVARSSEERIVMEEVCRIM